MAIKQVVIIICDGCGIEREYPGASTLDAIRHATKELGWWRGMLGRRGSAYREPTILCPGCCERQGGDPVLVEFEEKGG